ncbi:MAG: DUF3592 domain-containing protein [Alphaproteobacteria bacterium]
MFDLIFDGVSAWNSMGLFIMAAVFILIGGGISVYELMWLFSGKRVKGRIKEVRAVGKAGKGSETYYAVYEYQLPNGELREKVSSWGSGALGKNIPGREVRVLISPRYPNKMKKPHIAVLIFGFIFLLPGLFIMRQAVQTFEFNYMMVVLPLMFFAFIGFKIYLVVSKISEDDWREGMAAFRDARKEGFSVKSSGGGDSKNARVLSSDEIRERMKAHRKNYVVGGYICLLLAVGCAGGAYYLGGNMVGKLRVGIPAQGEVVGFESKYSSTSDGSGYTYYSIVEFTDGGGNLVKFQDGIGSSHRMHKRGDEVNVLYMPDDSGDAMIDRGIWNWAVSGGLALAAFLLMLAGMDNMKVARLYNGRQFKNRM